MLLADARANYLMMTLSSSHHSATPRLYIWSTATPKWPRDNTIQLVLNLLTASDVQENVAEKNDITRFCPELTGSGNYLSSRVQLLRTHEALIWHHLKWCPCRSGSLSRMGRISLSKWYNPASLLIWGLTVLPSPGLLALIGIYSLPDLVELFIYFRLAPNVSVSLQCHCLF